MQTEALTENTALGKGEWLVLQAGIPLASSGSPMAIYPRSGG